MHKNNLISGEGVFIYNDSILPSYLVPPTVKFNMQLNAKNPLFNEKITCFSLFKDNFSILEGSSYRPIVVANSFPNTIFMINKITKDKEVISAVNFATNTFQNNIPDSQGKITSKIISIEAFCPYVFALSNPCYGTFGEKGTGVAHMVVGTLNNKEQYFTGLMVLDALSGQIARVNGNRAFPLDITSDILKIGHDLKSISTGKLFWHKAVNRLYVILKVEGGTAKNDGARAVAIGRVDDKTHSLFFDAVVPASVFADNVDNVIGGIGSNMKVSIEKVKEFQTNAGLAYLIGIGGTGNNEKVIKKVFCLPLVNSHTNELYNGMIASKNSIPKLNKEKGNLEISEVAYDANEMPVYTDAEVMVGNGLLEYPALDLFLQDNKVICVTQDQDEVIVFASTPHFNKNGKIANWSQWLELYRFKNN
jgi:hypothetical protein